MLALALAIAGAVSAVSLPVGLFPNTAFPRLVVDLTSGSRPASETALVVTRPVEIALRAVPGVRDVRSNTTRGAAQLSVDFDWGTDMTASALLADAALASALPSLPAGTGYDVQRMTPSVYPIMSYALLSSTLSPVALRDLALFRITPLLASVNGLGHTDVQGGRTAEIEVTADPRRLALRGLAFADLAAALASGNVLRAVGRLQDNHRLYLVVADRGLQGAAGIGDVVVRAAPNGVVRVRDVADVRDGVAPDYLRIVEDGRPAVLFNIYQQPDANMVRIASDVRARLAGLPLPAGVRLVNWYDQSTLVVQSAGSVRDAVLIGLVLAGVVLMVFLRNWRVTALALAIVPATLAVTVLVLDLLGMGFDIMTLGGIAASVGLLIDDVITMVEHLARRSARAGGRDAVLPAAREFLQPLTGSSLATIIVFVPLSFLGGVTGSFSRALAVTMAAALVISYAMTAAIVPLLVRSAVDFERWHDPEEGRETALARVHRRLLGVILRRPILLGAALVPVLALGVLAFVRVPTGFLPDVDQGGFALDYYTAPGTSLAETSRQIGELDRWLHGNPAVATFSRRLGTGLGNDLGQSYHGDYFVLLKPGHAISTQALMQRTLDWAASGLPGVSVDASQLMEDRIGDLTAVPEPIQIKLYGASEQSLIPIATRVAAAIGHVRGVEEVKSGVELAGDSLDLRIDPARAALQGLTPQAVAAGVATALAGDVATTLPVGVETVEVRLSLPGARRLDLGALDALAITTPAGRVVPLGRVASIRVVTGEPQVSSDNLQPMIAVTGRIVGRGTSAAIADVERVLAGPGMLPPPVRYELGGLYQQQRTAFIGLARVFAAALIAEFILMLFLYERFALPVVIIGSALLATTAVFTGLWISGVSLNITALMGLTMIVGIGAEMAVFMVSEFAVLSREMPPRDAVREAARNRLRPIVMTTVTAILTLLPLALGIGAGAGLQQPLAIAIVSGLLLQCPLVLLGVPVALDLLVARRAQKA